MVSQTNFSHNIANKAKILESDAKILEELANLFKGI